MEAYTGFAEVYDLFMDNIPYEEWCDYIVSLLKENNVPDGIVLDLGCGTGSLTRLLSQKGYDLIGIDNSIEMLQIASEKSRLEEKEILYLEQDMREFELYGTVKAVISICDSMNYILEEDELEMVFKLVNNYLDPGGVFIFDLNTIYKYENILGDNVIAENREEGSFIWENSYYEDEMLNEYDLTLFIREKEDYYHKYFEKHYQRAYELDTIKILLKKAGLECLAVYDAFTKEPVKKDSERVYFVAKECTKK